MSDPWPPLPPGPEDLGRGTGTGADRRPTDPPGNTPPVPPVEAGDSERVGRMSPNRRALSITIVAVVGLLVIGSLVAGRAPVSGTPSFPPAGATTGPAGAAAATTRGLVAGALAAAGLQAEDVLSPYRPAEAARLAASPRIVLRAVIPSDPDRGRVVIYELLTTGDAATAGREQAAYVSSGVGRIQFPSDSRFTIRIVGTTVVFYAWTEASSPDVERAAAVSTALGTLGVGVDIPR